MQTKRKTPLPHQGEALIDIATELKVSDRATAVMACGTGKSLIGMWAAEQLNPKTIIVLLPSLSLLSQLLHEWIRENTFESMDYLCVCSDSSVAKGADEIELSPSDIDFPVTTDSKSVRRFLFKPSTGTKVVFSTYQSSPVVAEGMLTGSDGERIPFDVGVNVKRKSRNFMRQATTKKVNQDED